MRNQQVKQFIINEFIIPKFQTMSMYRRISVQKHIIHQVVLLCIQKDGENVPHQDGRKLI